jgi:ketosteroid isomerase-like protein
MTTAEMDPRVLLDRLVPAVNDHDLERLVDCFHPDYVNENPAHPRRGLRGNDQVRRNWTQIFGAVPDIRARVLRSAVDGDSLWTEWEMSGTRSDDGRFDMRGVFIFGVAEGRAKWARMFLEAVEETSGDADAAVSSLTGTNSARTSGTRS